MASPEDERSNEDWFSHLLVGDVTEGLLVPDSVAVDNGQVSQDSWSGDGYAQLASPYDQDVTRSNSEYEAQNTDFLVGDLPTSDPVTEEYCDFTSLLNDTLGQEFTTHPDGINQDFELFHNEKKHAVAAEVGLDILFHKNESDGSEAGLGDNEAAKRQARLMRNRESAQLSRQRKKVYVAELEAKLKTMQATVTELNATIAHLTSENVNLRRQLAAYIPQSGSGDKGLSTAAGGVFPFGIFGYHPMGMPGFVPSIPIPRLKTSGITSKASKKSKTQAEGNSNKNKRARKSLKGAGAVALAIFCLFSIFSPYFEVSPSSLWGFNAGNSQSSALMPWNGEIHNRGRVLMSFQEGENESRGIFSKKENENFENPGAIQPQKNSRGGLAEKTPEEISDSQKLKSMVVFSMEKQIVRQVKALPSGKNSRISENRKESAEEGLPRIFQDVNEIPSFLAHGFCSEIFQFETSQNPSRNSENVQTDSTVVNSTEPITKDQGKFHRRLGGIRGNFAVPLPPIEERNKTKSKDLVEKEPLQNLEGIFSRLGGETGNVGSRKDDVAVSLFTSPLRVSGFGDDEGIENGRLSRVFVVVLLNGVKYVTYSCKLPNVGATGKIAGAA